MQAIYAWYCTDEDPGICFDINLKDFADEIHDFERRKGDKGDLRLLMELYYDTIENHEAYDQLIQSKAENWELERIALIDRILMQMGISEMTHFEEIPIKVTINEYLEIAKKFSTPKSSKFINGILDTLYIQFKKSDQIQKSGRGLIEETLPKRRPGAYQRGPNPGGYGNQRPQGPPKPKSGPFPPNAGNPKPPTEKRPSNPEDPQGPGMMDDKKKRPRIRKIDNDNV